MPVQKTMRLYHFPPQDSSRMLQASGIPHNVDRGRVRHLLRSLWRRPAVQHHQRPSKTLIFPRSLHNATRYRCISQRVGLRSTSERVGLPTGTAASDSSQQKPRRIHPTLSFFSDIPRPRSPCAWPPRGCCFLPPRARRKEPRLAVSHHPKQNRHFEFCVLHRNNGVVTVLAPIRDYHGPQDPLSSPLLCATRDRYFSRLFVAVNPGKPGFSEARWIVSEDANVEHLLDVFISVDKIWAVSGMLVFTSWNTCIRTNRGKPC